MRIDRIIVHKYRDIYNYFTCKKLKNYPTIISRDCIGGILYKDLNLKFTSPTINLEFNNNDFILFCSYLREFLNTELKEYNMKSVSYPVGILKNKHGSIKIHFVHYTSFKQAYESWNRRRKRVNYSNIYIIMCIGPNGSEETVKKFEKLNYKHKILLTSNIDTQKYDNVYNMKCYNSGYKDSLIQHLNKYSIKRYLNEFDWIKFFNNKE